MDYEDPKILGFADTWPQMGGMLPLGYAQGSSDFDWEGDKPPGIDRADYIVYEAHVRAFTKSPTSGVKNPGTYAGMSEKMDYLEDLGINCLELLPINEFNELEYYAKIPGTDQFRVNFWGYSTVAFNAPMSRYSAGIANGGPAASAAIEVKTLVREAHKRGIEVILDIVFNHTAEGNEKGPTLSFRGIDNRVYYMLAPEG